jgi:hypothetical protein
MRQLVILSMTACVMAFLISVPSAAAIPTVHTYAETDQPIYYGDYFWDEDGIPHGRNEIVVDLELEQLYVYRGGVEIGRAMITRGWDEMATPMGTSTYDNAPMPYNLRLTWAGVAIHGAEVDDESATHGCIGVPLEFAQQLFRSTRVGDKVLITKRWKPEIYGG